MQRKTNTEPLPHDVIEHILEKLDVKTVLKFKLVSKQWNSTIQSRWFQERQLIHRKQSGNPDVLLVSILTNSISLEAMRTLVLGSSVSLKIPTPWENIYYNVGNYSCDGLVCLYDALVSNPNIVVNPSTRWHRAFPYSTYQLLKMRGKLKESAHLGFGKDKINGTYKPVWLYNSDELCLNNKNNNAPTVCEVFDFTSNAWRYVVPASPYPIYSWQDPVYLDGSLHWFTKDETMVLTLDLQSETFQVMSKTPFVRRKDSRRKVGMCNLADRLCVFEEKWANQMIWSFDSDQKIWKKIYSIDRLMTSPINTSLSLKPLAVVDNGKLLVCEAAGIGVELLIYDPQTKSYDLAYTCNDYMTASHLCYFQSLISIF
ncbi:F-box protein [Cardamine amara subsp. amara]|uniref:F-box protein n=1 Tax=Cardamine amara subsp. amara TaxID=228776 RepID=A0ABD1BVJ6_CARAN